MCCGGDGGSGWGTVKRTTGDWQALYGFFVRLDHKAKRKMITFEAISATARRTLSGATQTQDARIKTSKKRIHTNNSFLISLKLSPVWAR